jgi:putative acetyltransferase
MLLTRRVNNGDPDFEVLIGELDNDLFMRYPEIQQFYMPLNKVEYIDAVVIAYELEKPVGCGSFKIREQDSVEIKRMYVRPDERGKGIAQKILDELLTWAKELGFQKALLETGLKQHEAICLYEKSGFVRIDNFAPYQDMPNSICYMKTI